MRLLTSILAVIGFRRPELVVGTRRSDQGFNRIQDPVTPPPGVADLLTPDSIQAPRPSFFGSALPGPSIRPPGMARPPEQNRVEHARDDSGKVCPVRDYRLNFVDAANVGNTHILDTLDNGNLSASHTFVLEKITDGYTYRVNDVELCFDVYASDGSGATAVDPATLNALIDFAVLKFQAESEDSCNLIEAKRHIGRVESDCCEGGKWHACVTLCAIDWAKVRSCNQWDKDNFGDLKFDFETKLAMGIGAGDINVRSWAYTNVTKLKKEECRS